MSKTLDIIEKIFYRQHISLKAKNGCTVCKHWLLLYVVKWNHIQRKQQSTTTARLLIIRGATCTSLLLYHLLHPKIIFFCIWWLLPRLSITFILLYNLDINPAFLNHQIFLNELLSEDLLCSILDLHSKLKSNLDTWPLKSMVDSWKAVRVCLDSLAHTQTVTPIKSQDLATITTAVRVHYRS